VLNTDLQGGGETECAVERLTLLTHSDGILEESLIRTSLSCTTPSDTGSTSSEASGPSLSNTSSTSSLPSNVDIPLRQPAGARCCR
jgi:hypothetical protein